MLIGLKVDLIYACTLALLTYTENSNNNEATSVEGNSKHGLMLGGKRAKVMSTLTQDADQRHNQLFIFQTCKPWKIFPLARRQLRAPQVILRLSQCLTLPISHLPNSALSCLDESGLRDLPFAVPVTISICGGDCVASSTHS